MGDFEYAARDAGRKYPKRPEICKQILLGKDGAGNPFGV